MRAICQPDGTGVCVQCHRPFPPNVRRTCPAWLASNPNRNQRELGSLVERTLSRVGITTRRYVRLKQWLGLAPTCGCQARKEFLNRVSAWWRGNNP